ncbi:squalene/phytoene synthase family protein [Aliiroseovarius subalbicans]|uniref:squalene/phytoene synthase family protein n=1 Tax=Aliiroseovarius subalbicans TaxID=2925840 RepID=UPI001F55EE3A|nr:squalene/phytoene synthase family protein [Aliiroseovarius subalbicans]MCI2398219.1 squalene/phytoene synthase family protein [Aliiroseovarius subalbicans]
MSIQACAELVQKGDPDRFLSAMTGPVAARDVLFPLYAFNLELARAEFVSNEPMIARMRLQFWSDTLDEIAAGKPARAHEVAAPLAQVVRDTSADLVRLHALVEARVADVEGHKPDSTKAVIRYAEATAGNLMVLSARALGGTDTPTYVALGTAQGLANWFLAQSGLVAAGRGHVPPDTAQISELACAGLAALPGRLSEGDATPALRAAWRAKSVLKRAAKSPETVLSGAVGGSEFARRGGLLARTLLGR